MSQSLGLRKWRSRSMLMSITATPKNGCFFMQEIILFIFNFIHLLPKRHFLLRYAQSHLSKHLFRNPVPKPLPCVVTSLKPEHNLRRRSCGSSVYPGVTLGNGYQKPSVATELNFPFYAFSVPASGCASGIPAASKVSGDETSAAGSRCVSNAPFASPMPPEARTF